MFCVRFSAKLSPLHFASFHTSRALRTVALSPSTSNSTSAIVNGKRQEQPSNHPCFRTYYLLSAPTSVNSSIGLPRRSSSSSRSMRRYFSIYSGKTSHRLGQSSPHALSRVSSIHTIPRRHMFGPGTRVLVQLATRFLPALIPLLGGIVVGLFPIIRATAIMTGLIKAAETVTRKQKIAFVAFLGVTAFFVWLKGFWWEPNIQKIEDDLLHIIHSHFKTSVASLSSSKLVYPKWEGNSPFVLHPRQLSFSPSLEGIEVRGKWEFAVDQDNGFRPGKQVTGVVSTSFFLPRSQSAPLDADFVLTD